MTEKEDQMLTKGGESFSAVPRKIYSLADLSLCGNTPVTRLEEAAAQRVQATGATSMVGEQVVLGLQCLYLVDILCLRVLPWAQARNCGRAFHYGVNLTSSGGEHLAKMIKCAAEFFA